MKEITIEEAIGIVSQKISVDLAALEKILHLVSVNGCLSPEKLHDVINYLYRIRRFLERRATGNVESVTYQFTGDMERIDLFYSDLVESYMKNKLSVS